MPKKKHSPRPPKMDRADANALAKQLMDQGRDAKVHTNGPEHGYVVHSGHRTYS